MFANMDEETLLYACKVLVENSMKNKMNLNSSNSGQKAENLEKNFSEIKSKDNAPERKLSDEEIEADERKKIKEEEEEERKDKLRENVRKKYAEEKAAKEKKAEKIKAKRIAQRKKEEEKDIKKTGKKQGKKEKIKLRNEKKSQWSEEEFKIRKEELENKKKEIGKKKEEIKDKEEEIKKKKEEMKNSGKNIWEQKEEIKKQENEVRKEEKMIEKQEREVEKQEQEIKKYEELQIDGPVELFGEEYKEESNIAEKDKELALKNNAKMVATLATAETKQKIEKEKELNETDKKDEKKGLFGKFKGVISKHAHSMSDGIKDVVGEKKKSFNDSKFSKLTGLVFSSDEDKDEVEEKNEEPSFNTKGEFLAWLDAQDTAIKLKNNAKELKRRIERKYNFLKIYNYKSSDEGVKKILGEISSLINEEKTDIYKNIEMLKGEDLEKYLHDTAEVIDNLKIYNKKLDGIFKDKGIPELDLDNDEDYHGSSSNWDDGEDKSKLNIFKPLETVLKATGYFMKEIVSKLEEKDVKQLKEILTKNFYFNGSGQGSFKATGDIQKAINAGEDQAVDKFNEKIKEILKLSLNKDVKPLCSNSKVYEFFEKICKDGLDDIDDIEESDLENLKKYMAEQEKIN